MTQPNRPDARPALTEQAFCMAREVVPGERVLSLDGLSLDPPALVEQAYTSNPYPLAPEVEQTTLTLWTPSHMVEVRLDPAAEVWVVPA